MKDVPMVGLTIIVAFGFALAGIVVVPILLLLGWMVYSIFTM